MTGLLMKALLFPIKATGPEQSGQCIHYMPLRCMFIPEKGIVILWFAQNVWCKYVNNLMWRDHEIAREVTLHPDFIETVDRFEKDPAELFQAVHNLEFDVLDSLPAHLATKIALKKWLGLGQST